MEYINAKFAAAAGSEQALDEALDPFIAQVTAEIGACLSIYRDGRGLFAGCGDGWMGIWTARALSMGD